VRLRDERGPEDLVEESAPTPVVPEVLEEQANVAADFLDDLLDIMDIDVGVEVHVEHDGAFIELEGDEIGLLIGRHGATLDALQDVTRAAVRNKLGDWPNLTLDAEGYHARRRDNLEQRAHSIAEKVKRTGKPVALSPMSASERKIVHETLVRISGVRTESAGEGLDRHVVIHPA
jgi:spoIIIJ-associated protein